MDISIITFHCTLIIAREIRNREKIDSSNKIARYMS